MNVDLSEVLPGGHGSWRCRVNLARQASTQNDMAYSYSNGRSRPAARPTQKAIDKTELANETQEGVYATGENDRGIYRVSF